MSLSLHVRRVDDYPTSRGPDAKPLYELEAGASGGGAGDRSCFIHGRAFHVRGDLDNIDALIDAAATALKAELRSQLR